MIRTTISIAGYQGRRRHLSVGKNGHWVLQWAYPTEHGYRYDPPLEGKKYARRKDAETAKRLILAPAELRGVHARREGRLSGQAEVDRAARRRLHAEAWAARKAEERTMKTPRTVTWQQLQDQVAIAKDNGRADGIRECIHELHLDAARIGHSDASKFHRLAAAKHLEDTLLAEATQVGASGYKTVIDPSTGDRMYVPASEATQAGAGELAPRSDAYKAALQRLAKNEGRPLDLQSSADFIVTGELKPPEAPVCKDWCGDDCPGDNIAHHSPECFIGPVDKCWCSPACRAAGRPVRPRELNAT